MSKPTPKEETIRHLSDLKATYEHVLHAVDLQSNEEHIVSKPEAAKMVAHTKSELTALCNQLEQELKILGQPGGNSTIKEAVTTLLGKIAGAWNHARDYKASRGLRDAYTALSLCAAATTTLHGFALVVNDVKIANLALSHQETLSNLIIAYSKEIPKVSARETASLFGKTLDPSVQMQAVENTQRIWSGQKATVG
jgi:hypothetical protein